MDTVDRFDADGVIMATHGRTGLPHLLYGSVTEAVLANSPTPVFVVYARPGEAPAPAFSLTLARMLVPQDGSAYDAPALRMALDMLGTCGQIVLVSVVPPVRHLPRAASSHVLAYADQQEESRWQAARDYLNRIADALRSRPVPVDVKVDVRMGDPAGGIALASIEQGADLIVMATHGLTGIRRAVLGSVAGGVLRSTPTPVLLVHPTRPASVSAGPALPATLP
jgi:nucleotide-binding universal stress UspA family protein